MCGIAGFVASGASLGEPELEAMLRKLRHRGPDGAGVRIFDLPGGRRVGLAHARLAMVDPSPAGAQPMERGDLALVLNGEIYDFRRHRERLEREGRPFRTRSDAEVLLALWEEKGPAALAEIVGTYSLALLDRRRGELLLARDPIGKKPLHFARVPGAFAFASELRALETLPGFRREVDGQALREYLTLGYVPAPSTIYAQARKLTPGSLLRVAGGAEEPASEPIPPRVNAEGGLEAVLRDAVALRLAADAPVGVFLSGGIDSSLVAALAAESGGGRLRTFSLVLPGSSLDESARARRVAEALGADHAEEALHPTDLEEWVERLPEVLDEPLADSSILPTAALARAARSSVKAVLTGEGGDELFAGYDRYRGMRLLARLASWPPGLRRAAASALATGGRILGAPEAGSRSRAERFAEAIRSPREAAAYGSLVGLFPPEEVDALLGSSGPMGGGGGAIARAWGEGEGEGGADAAERAMRADQRTYLVDDLLAKVDRATMAFGLEARCPLLDPRVVALAASLPLSEKLRGRRSKAGLRSLLARRFPRAWFAGRKRGFAIPLAGWMRRLLGRGGLLDPARLAGEGWLVREAPEVIGRWVAEFRAGRGDRAARLWGLLALARWRERTGAFLREGTR